MSVLTIIAIWQVGNIHNNSFYQLTVGVRVLRLRFTGDGVGVGCSGSFYGHHFMRVKHFYFIKRKIRDNNHCKYLPEIEIFTKQDLQFTICNYSQTLQVRNYKELLFHQLAIFHLCLWVIILSATILFAKYCHILYRQSNFIFQAYVLSRFYY